VGEDRPLDFWDLDEWQTIVTPWPDSVKKAIGGNLRVLQHGEMPASHCKTLQGFPIPLLELWHRSGQRVICTTEFASLTNRIHVLDAFMKDSRERRRMRQSDKARIERRARDLKQRMEALKKSVEQTEMVRRKVH
jgi:hypothetical protein